MNGKIPKSTNNNLKMKSSKQQISLIKFNSSKIKRNSTSFMFDKFQNEYLTKYFELYDKSLKGDTSKNSRKNKNLSILKSPKKNKRESDLFKSTNINNINNYLEKLYQNDNHMKKNIVKKKKNDSNKKQNLKVSFLMNLTRKNDSLKSKKKKLDFSNYINNENESNKNSETKNQKENFIDEEDEQAYGFNKRYKIKMFDEINKDKHSLNKEEHTPKINQVHIFKKNKEIDVDSERDKTNKTFISPNFHDSDFHLKSKIKKTRGNTNFKKLKKKLSESKKVQEKANNNNVVNINYNINVRNPKNDKHKNNAIKKKESNKALKIFKSTENINKPELLIVNKNKESSNTNKTSNLKNNNNEDKNNTLMKDENNNKIYKYIQNCCFPFFACLKGNND